MPDFSSDTVAQILAACEAGRTAAAEVLSTTLGETFEMSVGELSPSTEGDQTRQWDTPGLLFHFELQDASVYGLLPADSGLLPDWCLTADETSAAKLQTLADQLSQHLLPDILAPNAARGEYLDDPSNVLAGNAAASFLPLTLNTSATEKTGTLWVIWPAENPAPTDAQPTDETAEPPRSSVGSPGAEAPNQPAPRRPRQINYSSIEDGLRQLPTYAQSLLKVPLPVRATLATTKIPLERVLELGPGSIIQFKKSCEDPLTLQAGGQEIAEGEAVKVGDKFGLWITAISMPEERFWVMQSGTASQRVK